MSFFQLCELKFASWSHDITEINLGLNTDKGDLSSYMNNSEFDLVDMTAVREVVRFPSDTNSDWPTIVIRIHMHRRPLFYVFNHIVPCVLISSMAVLGFLMPPETGEKINMIITTLLSMGVYLQSITESIPPTSEGVPLIGERSSFPTTSQLFSRNVLRVLSADGLSCHLRQRDHSQHAPERSSESGKACACLDAEVDSRVSGDFNADVD